jgi:hypothetical protein
MRPSTSGVISVVQFVEFHELFAAEKTVTKAPLLNFCITSGKQNRAGKSTFILEAEPLAEPPAEPRAESSPFERKYAFVG